MMNELQVITPEMTLAGLGCLVLLVDVYKREESNLTFWTASLSLVVVCLLVVVWRPDQPVYVFGSTFKLDQVSSLLKIFILITGLGAFFILKSDLFILVVIYANIFRLCKKF